MEPRGEECGGWDRGAGGNHALLLGSGESSLGLGVWQLRHGENELIVHAMVLD